MRDERCPGYSHGPHDAFNDDGSCSACGLPSGCQWCRWGDHPSGVGQCPIHEPEAFAQAVHDRLKPSGVAAAKVKYWGGGVAHILLTVNGVLIRSAPMQTRAAEKAVAQILARTDSGMGSER